MMRVRSLVVAAAFVAVAAALPGCGKDNPVKSNQYTLISNMDTAGTGFLSLDSLHQASAAVGFRMPPVDYHLDYIKLRLAMPLGSLQNVVFRLFDADTAGAPRQAIMDLPHWSSNFTNAAQDFTLTPRNTTILRANQIYWVVGYCSTGPSILVARTWSCGGTPTGIATHVGSKYQQYILPNPPMADTTLIAKYAVVGTAS